MSQRNTTAPVLVLALAVLGCGGPLAAPDSGSGGVAACRPDHDGFITRAEVPLAPGLAADFRVAVDAPVDTRGEVDPDGSRRWDLATDLPGDHTVRIELTAPAGAWWASSFAGAT